MCSRGDAGPVVGDGDAVAVRDAPCSAARRQTRTVAPAPPYFIALSIRLVKTCASWSRSPSTGAPAGVELDLERHPLRRATGSSAEALSAAICVQRPFLDRAQVLGHLDAAERHQVVDQALHAPRLARHDPEEALARLGSSRAWCCSVSM